LASQKIARMHGRFHSGAVKGRVLSEAEGSVFSREWGRSIC
jgi:hypothetical protein